MTNNDLMNTTAAAPISDADLAALGEAARESLAGEFVGTPMKYRQGHWYRKPSKGEEVEIGNTETFIIDPLSFAKSWVKWENKQKTGQVGPGRRVDGFLLPLRDQLPDQDENRWPYDKHGKRQDPWSENHQITMKDSANGDLLTYVTTSWGGYKAIGRLLEAFFRDARKHPGMYPVVLLELVEGPSDYGRQHKPALSIVDWAEFGEGAAPPGAPIRQDDRVTTGLAPAPKVVQLAPPKAQEQEGEWFEEPSKKTTGMKAAGGAFDNFDDIPFGPCI